MELTLKSQNTFFFNFTYLFSKVTVADYADADPAVVKSGRVKKAVANAVEKEGILKLC